MDHRDRAGEMFPHSFAFIFDADVILGTSRLLLMLALYVVAFGGLFWLLGSAS